MPITLFQWVECKRENEKERASIKDNTNEIVEQLRVKQIHKSGPELNTFSGHPWWNTAALSAGNGYYLIFIFFLSNFRWWLYNMHIPITLLLKL